MATLVAWVTQLEIEAEISHSITNAGVELGFTKAPGPDFFNFNETTKEEGFFYKLTREHLLEDLS